MAAAAAAAPQADAPLPFLGDDIFVLIAAELDARMLGRLACAAQRFWRRSVPDPAHKGSAPPELWSVAEEGARRRLAAQGEQVRGWVSRGGVGGSWLRALGEAGFTTTYVFSVGIRQPEKVVDLIAGVAAQV